MSLFPLAVITIFLQVEIGLRTDQILLLQAVKSGVSALFEFPAGWIADRLGYKKTFIVGACALFGCWSIYSFGDTFSTILIADILLGVGWSFIYGTDSAFLYESLANLQQTEQLSKWSGRVSFWGQLAEGGCALLAGLLYHYSPRLPFALQALMSVGNLVIAYFLVEPPRVKSLRKDTFKEIVDMFKLTFIDSKVLRYASLLFIFMGIASYLQVWNIQLYAKENGIGTIWLGVNWAVANLFVAIGSILSHRFERHFGVIKSLYICLLLITLGYTGLFLLPGTVGFLCYYFLTLERGLNYPILNSLKQNVISSENRAGMLSITNFAFRLIFAAICPVAGYLILSYGFQQFFGISGVIFVCISLMLIMSLKKHLPE
jgi:MFS family permease